MTIKEFKRRWLNSKIEPELFYMPVKKKEEPFILKIKVFEDGGQAYIMIVGNINVLQYYTYRYTDMAVEYANTKRIDTSSQGNVIGDIKVKSGTGVTLTNASGYDYTTYYVISDLVLNDPDDYLITDDIDYFRADADPYLKTTGKKLIFSKMVSEKSWGGRIDWGDGTVEDLSDLIKKYSDDEKSFKYMSGTKLHVYETAGEYTIKIYGHVPGLRLNADSYTSSSGTYRWINALPKEIVSFGDLDMYCIDSLINYYPANSNEKYTEMRNNFRLPRHVSAGMFRHVISAYNAFGYLQLTKSAFPEEFFTSFISVFPYLIYGAWMFQQTLVEEIPDNFCNGHDFLMNCEGMFAYSRVGRIGNYAFANCKKLTSVYDLTNGNSGAENQYLTTVGNYVFENDENLIYISCALGYCSDRDIYKYPDKGLETVGDGIFKNCKRMRNAYESFYQQSRLKTVGKDLFAGCEDLIDVSFCFYFCRSLKTIGEGIFKGCSKVRKFADFFYMDFLVDYPDYMLYDVKYYDYLCLAKASNYTSELGFNFNCFNYCTEMSGDSHGSISHLEACCPGFNKDDWTTFPTRKACEHMFSDELINDVITSGKTLFYDDMSLHSLLTNEIYGSSGTNIHFTPFTGRVWNVTKYPGYESLFPDATNGVELYGVRRMTFWDTNTGEPQYHDICYNLLENYDEIAVNCPWLAYPQYNSDGSLNHYEIIPKSPALLHDWGKPSPGSDNWFVDAPGSEIIYIE